MAQHPKAKIGLPRTGDGRNPGRKPKTEDLRMLRDNGRVARDQPPGWVGKVINLFGRKP